MAMKLVAHRPSSLGYLPTLLSESDFETLEEVVRADREGLEWRWAALGTVDARPCSALARDRTRGVSHASSSGAVAGCG